MMKVKVVFGQDIRRWRYPQSNRFSELINFSRSTFNLSWDNSFHFQFEDEEGDRITVSSENDFNEALMTARDDGRKSLKIFVINYSIENAREQRNSHNRTSTPSIVSLASSDGFDVISNVSGDDPYVSSRPASEVSQVEPVIEPELEFEAAIDEGPDMQKNATIAQENGDDNVNADADGDADVDPNVALLRGFLQNEEIQSILPEFICDIIRMIRDDSSQNVQVAMIRVLTMPEYTLINEHELFIEFVQPRLDLISVKLTPLVVVLSTFDDDMIYSLLPQLIDAAIGMMCGVSDVEFDVTTLFERMFPQRVAMLNAQNPQGGVINLADLFNCRNAEEAAQEMMTRNNNEDETVVHDNIICDVCDASPITGSRYKCCVCSNFDMCSACEREGLHDQTHALIKMNVPTRGFVHGTMPGIREMFNRSTTWWRGQAPDNHTHM